MISQQNPKLYARIVASNAAIHALDNAGFAFHGIDRVTFDKVWVKVNGEYKSFKDTQTAARELLPTGHLPEAKQLKFDYV